MFGLLDRKNWIGLITAAGLLAFEIFNYATNQETFRLVIGNLTFVGVPIYYLLAVAFSAIDLGGLSSTFTKEDFLHEHWWVYAATGGWFIASVINGYLTYIALVVAIAAAPISKLATAMPKIGQVYDYIPAAIAVTIWLIRIMLIGSAVAGTNKAMPSPRRQSKPMQVSAAPTATQARTAAPVNVTRAAAPVSRPPANQNFRPTTPPDNAPKPVNLTKEEDEIKKMLGL